MTTGASEPSLSERGIHGRLSDLLHPVQHGVFWFAGIAPLEPFAVYDANSMTAERYAAAERAYGQRLDGLFTDEPIPYRTLTGGDYGHDMRLLPDTAGPGSSGADLHVRPRT
ncbi:NAD(P)H-dependent oxidoreductase [Streptomyces sp. NPDC054802]